VLVPDTVSVPDAVIVAVCEPVAVKLLVGLVLTEEVGVQLAPEEGELE
jgi:hypothetical protein